MSLDFDGTGDYALLPSRDFRTTDFTFAFWLYPRSYNGIYATNLMNNKQGSKIQFSIYIFSNMVFEFQNRYGNTLADVKFPKGYVFQLNRTVNSYGPVA